MTFVKNMSSVDATTNKKGDFELLLEYLLACRNGTASDSSVPTSNDRKNNSEARLASDTEETLRRNLRNMMADRHRESWTVNHAAQKAAADANIAKWRNPEWRMHVREVIKDSQEQFQPLDMNVLRRKKAKRVKGVDGEEVWEDEVYTIEAIGRGEGLSLAVPSRRESTFSCLDQVC